jgi:hypothetical protein
MAKSDKQSTAEGIHAALVERIARGELQLHIAGCIRNVARKMEGKTITKRFATACAEAIKADVGSSFVVHYSTEYSRYALEIWGGALGDHSDRMLIYIGRMPLVPGYGHGPHEVSEEGIVKQNQAYFLEAERLPKLRAARDANKAADWAQRIATIKALRDALAAEAYEYSVSYLLDI